MSNCFWRSSTSLLTVTSILLMQASPVFAQTLPIAEPADSRNFTDSPSDSSSRTRVLPAESEDDAYVLGPGDVIGFDVFNVPEITVEPTYNVLSDGTINLPWIGRVPVRGLSLEDATRRVENRYSEFILDPTITLTLLTPRPVQVAVVGEVNRPGVYSKLRTLVDAGDDDVEDLRTVAEAVQAAGGITQLADIRNIEIRRSQLDGSSVIIPVDFFALLDGAQEQNLRLRDGDTVVIPTVTEFNPAEAEALASANFSPTVVGIDVVGEVKAPGRVEIKPNSTLNQAILAAGGFDDARAQTGRVAFIRLNPDGTVTNRTVDVNLSDGINEETNPPVRANDIIIVSRSGLAGSSDFLQLLSGAAAAIINPVLGVTSIIDQINRLGDPDR